MSSINIKTALIIGSLAALSACGGGGDSGPTITKYPVDLATSDFFQMAHSYHLAGSAGSDSYTLTLDITAGSQASFQGVQAMTSTTTSTLTKDGATIGTSKGTQYFLTTPFTQLGATYSTGMTEVVGNQQPLPEFANVGDSGAFDTEKYYSSPALTTEIGTGTRTWSLTSLSSDTAQFCIHDTDDIGGPTETEIDCYDMDAKGNITAIETTLDISGQAVTFR